MSRWIGRGALGGLLAAALAVAWLALARALTGPGPVPVPQETALTASTGIVRALWQLALGTLAGGLLGAICGAFGIRIPRRAAAAGGALLGALAWAAATLGWLGALFGSASLGSAIAYALYGAVAASFLGGVPESSRTP
ncbi:MAG TPA: hypothetical protein VNM16_08490 [Bacillota bacterium]|nr:hypothetical protein [Bacillota bacterium]